MTHQCRDETVCHKNNSTWSFVDLILTHYKKQCYIYIYYFHFKFLTFFKSTQQIESRKQKLNSSLTNNIISFVLVRGGWVGVMLKNIFSVSLTWNRLMEIIKMALGSVIHT